MQQLISYEFFIFLIIVFIVYYLVHQKYRYLVLLIFNIIFYTIVGHQNIIFIISAAIVTFLMGVLINDQEKYKKYYLFLGIVYNLLLLLILKYIYFSTNMYNKSLVAIGVSFYTLQNIGYLIDVYKAKIKNEKNLLKYLTFAMYFPTLFIGPINRYDALNKELFNNHPTNKKNIKNNFVLLLLGLTKKLVIAERLQILISSILSNNYNGAYTLLTLLFFMFRIYFDFSGGIDIVRGFSGMLGINLMENFKRPYFASSLKDFWRRWHISLSSWFKDYIYIPLGGNQKGIIRTKINTIIVFLLSGLWHGSNYILWGLLNGLYMIIEPSLKIKNNQIKKIITLIVIFFLWSFYVYETPYIAIKMLGSIFTVNNYNIFINNSILNLDLNLANIILLLIFIIIFMSYEYLVEKKKIKDYFNNKKLLKYQNALIIVLIFIIIIFGIYGIEFNVSDFIYNKF